MWTKEFWMDAIERTLYTVVEALLGYLTVAATITEVDWLEALSVAGVAGLITLLKCLAVVLVKK